MPLSMPHRSMPNRSMPLTGRTAPRVCAGHAADGGKNGTLYTTAFCKKRPAAKLRSKCHGWALCWCLSPHRECKPSFRHLPRRRGLDLRIPGGRDTRHDDRRECPAPPSHVRGPKPSAPTWVAGPPLTAPLRSSQKGPGEGPCEPSLATLADGRVLAVFRLVGGESHRGRGGEGRGHVFCCGSLAHARMSKSSARLPAGIPLWQSYSSGNSDRNPPHT